ARAVADVGLHGGQVPKKGDGSRIGDLEMTAVPFSSPRRVAAHALDAELSREAEMFGDLIAVHGLLVVRLKPDTTSAGEELFDAIEHRDRDLRLALKGEAGDVAGAFGSDKRHFVRVDVEAGVVARHVVGDDEIDVLA